MQGRGGSSLGSCLEKRKPKEASFFPINHPLMTLSKEAYSSTQMKQWGHNHGQHCGIEHLECRAAEGATS